MAFLRPPEVMRQVHVQTLNPEAQDNILWTSQPSNIHTFFQVESIIEEARVNLQKQQSAFHLRHRDATRSLKVSWNGVNLENTAQPKCSTYIIPR